MTQQSTSSGFALVITSCLKSSVALDSLRSKHQNAGDTIAALSSGSSAVGGALFEVQHLLPRNSAVRNRPEILDTLEKALAGCKLLFKSLEGEIGKLSLPDSKSRLKMPWVSKAAVVWDEAKMREYLSRVQHQQVVLSFLINLLYLKNVDEIHGQLKENSSLLQQQEAITQSLRISNPQVEVPESVIDIKKYAGIAFEDDASTLTAPELQFNNAVVNSRSPPRAIATDPITASESEAAQACDAPPAYRLFEAEVGKWEPSTSVMCLEIDCEEIAFKRPFNRPRETVVHIRNPNIGPVVFKVQINAHLAYAVRPANGRIEAGGVVALLITKNKVVPEPAADETFKHRLLFKSFAVAPDEPLGTPKLLSAHMESVLSSPNLQNLVQGKKVRVVYLPPDDPATTKIWH